MAEKRAIDRVLAFIKVPVKYQMCKGISSSSLGSNSDEIDEEGFVDDVIMEMERTINSNHAAVVVQMERMQSDAFSMCREYCRAEFAKLEEDFCDVAATTRAMDSCNGYILPPLNYFLNVMRLISPVYLPNVGL